MPATTMRYEEENMPQESKKKTSNNTNIGKMRLRTGLKQEQT